MEFIKEFRNRLTKEDSFQLEPNGAYYSPKEIDRDIYIQYQDYFDIETMSDYLYDLKDSEDFQDWLQVLMDSKGLNVYDKYITFNYTGNGEQQKSSDKLLDLLNDEEIKYLIELINGKDSFLKDFITEFKKYVKKY